MPAAVKLIECPRDAWQGLQGQIPAYIKADYLKALISAGFKHIDAASFVSPKAVPQMADSEEVLKDLDPPDDVEIIPSWSTRKARSGPSPPRPCARWVSHTRFRQRFSRTIRSRRWKTRSRNWKRSKKRRTRPGSTWWSTSRWPSAIPTAISGI